MQKYRINEIYRAIQGEGWHSGLPCTLVRFQGCNLRCSFCDTKHALDPEGGKEYRLDELCEYIERLHFHGDIVLLTGGEPTMQPIHHLARALKGKGPIHLETNGTYAIQDRFAFDWITVSPKTGPTTLDTFTVEKCHEIKWLVDTWKDIDILKRWLVERQLADRKKICLQPISQDAEATEIAYTVCMKYGWRLSLQLHKYIGKE